MLSARIAWLSSFGFVIALGGCGTYVPEIQEFWGNSKDASYKVNKISGQVACELRKAVQQVFWDNENNPTQFVCDAAHPCDPENPPPRHRDLAWFELWAAQVTLNLNIVENTNLAPGASFINHLSNAVLPLPGGNVGASQMFTLGVGGTLSSTATRTDKLNMFFTVKELKSGKPSTRLSCIPNRQANADVFLQSDLKLYDWLSAALLPYNADIINYQNNSTAQNAISHEVKFEIVSNGNVNPTWTLVRFTGNSSGNLFGAGRDRTQDLTITFGPTQQNGKSPPELATPAANSHLANEIGTAVAQAIEGQPTVVQVPIISTFAAPQ